ncbi:MAG: dTMP kinase [Oscillospiraceae bacterium]
MVYMSNGRLIVLEGLDGCGKSTQLERVAEHFKQREIPHRVVSFPNYNSPSGQVISEYLAGKIPCEGETGAYAAGSFYAADRYISWSTDWKHSYERGEVILCGRYTTSNAIYQTAKLPADKRREYLNRLYNYEYVLLGLPKPDLVMYLDMPLEVSQKLLSKRYEGDESMKDIHESNLEFMKACRESAYFAAERGGWEIISCAQNGEPKPIEAITEEILSKIRAAL